VNTQKLAFNSINDNRNYKYIESSVSKRKDYAIISKWVRNGSSVIDLGSGDGTLLKILKDQKKARVIGIEISSSGITAAKKKGIESVVGRIDIKLPYKDKVFDYAICNVTLQMVMYPEILLSEMKRISKYQIVTFPNFAFILNRFDLFINGIMPRIMIPTYKWYSTGHIHQLSIRDFGIYCKDNGVRIMKTAHIGPGSFLYLPSKFLVKLSPNLFAMEGIFMTK
jgi:methionine biosynthesis protein MetW